MTPPRPQPAVERPVRYIGRMGLQITEKRVGDRYWNVRAQKWDVVR